MVTPVARREAAARLGEVYGMSERWACQAIGVDRSSVHYRSRRRDDGVIRSRFRELPLSVGALATVVYISCSAERASI
jgi:putative transposase